MKTSSGSSAQETLTNSHFSPRLEHQEVSSLLGKAAHFRAT